MTRPTIDEQIILLRRAIISIGDPRIQDEAGSMNQDLDAGEVEVACHQLCSQLIEYAIPIASRTRADLELIGRAVGLDQKYWNLLTVETVDGG